MIESTASPESLASIIEAAKAKGQTVLISDGKQIVAVMHPPDYEVQRISIVETVNLKGGGRVDR